MSAPSRNRLQIDERRAQLLELGLRLFAEHAYDEVSIDDIAEAAGISKGLLYHYFGGKRDFYVATVRSAAEQLQRRTEPDPSLPPPDRARSGIEGYLGFVEEHAAAYSALMRSGIGNDPEVAGVVEETREAIVRRMLSEIGVAQPRPVFRFVVRSWIGLVEAASLDWLDKKDVPREVVVQMLLESLTSMLMIALRLDPESGVVLGAPVEAVVIAAAPLTASARASRPRRSRAGTR